MGYPVPANLATPINQPVLAYLEGLSAHSDIAEILFLAVKPLGDVQRFCPDPASYRYLAVSTKGIIFGYAVGMDTIAFRLDDRMRARALATGGVAQPKCGPEWVEVMTRRPDADWPAVDVKFWAQKAYVFARS